MSRRSSYNPAIWKMSRAQHGLFFELWEKVCAAQGFDQLSSKDCELKRKAILAEVFHGPKSAKDINAKDEFDAIKKKFLELADIVEADSDAGERRRLLWSVEHFFKPCLKVYVADVEEYLRVVLRDRFKVVRGLDTYEGLSSRPRMINDGPSGQPQEKPSQLQMFIFTLGQRLQKFRKDFGDTIHDMKIKAGVKCDCAECAPRGVAEARSEDPVHAEIENENVPF